MKNRVRIHSDENLVMNAKIELLGPDGEYVDVSRCVTAATVTLKVGEVSRAHLDLFTCDATTEADCFTAETLRAFANALVHAGWYVETPNFLPVRT